MTAETIERRLSGAPALVKRERDFMAGKRLAAEVVLHAAMSDPGGKASVHMSYRDRGVPQDNYTRPLLERIVAQPELLDGFSAGLSSALAEVVPEEDGEQEYRALAALSYDACTVYHEYDEESPYDGYTEPVTALVDFEDQPAQPAAPMSAVMSVALLEDPEAAYFLAGQAADILGLLADAIAEHDALRALRDLAESYACHIGQAVTELHYGSVITDVSGMLDLMRMLDADKLGGGAFYGAMSLLTLSMVKLEEKRDTLFHAKQEQTHA
ncbi:MAG: hypothetical protein QM777_08745 [Pseudorhodoferax sp.]